MRIFLACLLIAFACFSCEAAPVKKQDDEDGVHVLGSEREDSGDGYKFVYQLSDGQQRQEQAYFRKVDDVDVLTIEGFYSFVGDDGLTYRVSYRADENGYNVNAPEPIPAASQLVASAVVVVPPPARAAAKPEESKSAAAVTADEESEEIEVDVDTLGQGEDEDEEFNPDEFETEPPVQLSPNLIASLAG